MDILAFHPSDESRYDFVPVFDTFIFEINSITDLYKEGNKIKANKNETIIEIFWIKEFYRKYITHITDYIFKIFPYFCIYFFVMGTYKTSLKKGRNFESMI